MRKFALVLVFSSLSIFAEEVIAQDFLWGTATSEYQVSGSKGCPNSSWVEFEKQEGSIKNASCSLAACNHLEWTERYVGAVKDLGCNAYRFSIEWSKFQPEEDSYDYEVLDKYSQFVDHLIEAGITPMVVLHHISDPAWFLEKGGFAVQENCSHFVEFAMKVIEKLGDRVKLFVTFNEPTTYAVHGYNPPLLADPFPPSQKDKNTMNKVVTNMVRAHCSIYQNVHRSLSHLENVKMGIIYQFIRFAKGAIPDWYYVNQVEKQYQDAFYLALKNKKFEFSYTSYNGQKLFFSAPVKEMLDFIGINYFSKPLIRYGSSSFNEGEFLTDGGYRSYPQGLYEILTEFKSLAIPMYVTGSGIADEKDIYRARWIREHLHEMRRAMQDGADVRGFFYWSLMDSFEWIHGYSQKFGLYEYDFSTHDMKMREGSKEYVEEIKKAQASL
jgi:beta-glucosidase